MAPDCPYGYYDTAPYGCAPTGYYGPEWFNGDGFIGAGPWFHGARRVPRQRKQPFHPDHGYKGPTPKSRRESRVVKARRQLRISKETKRAMDVAT